MRRELAIEFSRVTESAALAGYKWLGRGDKNTADGAAVNAMRIMLNRSNQSEDVHLHFRVFAIQIVDGLNAANGA